jgi:hypothetical protein
LTWLVCEEVGEVGEGGGGQGGRDVG